MSLLLHPMNPQRKMSVRQIKCLSTPPKLDPSIPILHYLTVLKSISNHAHQLSEQSYSLFLQDNFLFGGSSLLTPVSAPDPITSSSSSSRIRVTVSDDVHDRLAMSMVLAMRFIKVALVFLPKLPTFRRHLHSAALKPFEAEAACFLKQIHQYCESGTKMYLLARSTTKIPTTTTDTVVEQLSQSTATTTTTSTTDTTLAPTRPNAFSSTDALHSPSPIPSPSDSRGCASIDSVATAELVHKPKLPDDGEDLERAKELARIDRAVDDRLRKVDAELEKSTMLFRGRSSRSTSLQRYAKGQRDSKMENINSSNDNDYDHDIDNDSEYDNRSRCDLMDQRLLMRFESFEKTTNRTMPDQYYALRSNLAPQGQGLPSSSSSSTPSAPLSPSPSRPSPSLMPVPLSSPLPSRRPLCLTSEHPTVPQNTIPRQSKVKSMIHEMNRRSILELNAPTSTTPGKMDDSALKRLSVGSYVGGQLQSTGHVQASRPAPLQASQVGRGAMKNGLSEPGMERTIPPTQFTYSTRVKRLDHDNSKVVAWLGSTAFTGLSNDQQQDHDGYEYEDIVEDDDEGSFKGLIRVPTQSSVVSSPSHGSKASLSNTWQPLCASASSDTRRPNVGMNEGDSQEDDSDNEPLQYLDVYSPEKGAETKGQLVPLPRCGGTAMSIIDQLTHDHHLCTSSRNSSASCSRTSVDILDRTTGLGSSSHDLESEQVRTGLEPLEGRYPWSREMVGSSTANGPPPKDNRTMSVASTTPTTFIQQPWSSPSPPLHASKLSPTSTGSTSSLHFPTPYPN
ncbi:hypothetical protein BG011_003148 [Mortierella polycephala]|uniref:Uncharacterized protein n=1 Tax=Mortierella polycephala TaxID=41804 RepID=A0A9P6Q5T8_9FUNG|nr:hypothetical protein BG011_003148 [Mortierella polycephala]